MVRAGRAVAAGMTTPLVKPLYTARATATGGRSGHAVTDDGQVDVHLKPPKEMGGPGGGANPEQLFAAGYAACFQSALAEAAHQVCPYSNATRGNIEVTLESS